MPTRLLTIRYGTIRYYVELEFQTDPIGLRSDRTVSVSVCLFGVPRPCLKHSSFSPLKSKNPHIIAFDKNPLSDSFFLSFPVFFFVPILSSSLFFLSFFFLSLLLSASFLSPVTPHLL
ncbi:hypothetical protein RchiOBHm_Chr5g0016301 [Rosa chinensis]|uniref:Uncharacterized protein n=1 Tax=Rosa chinensis TaxID=74649 RepID=A0A2P6Q670_ROSCH|nr:hypothetical protein RchiOBHm_Chr5g0016301 [Rosa chinensis]